MLLVSSPIQDFALEEVSALLLLFVCTKAGNVYVQYHSSSLESGRGLDDFTMRAGKRGRGGVLEEQGVCWDYGWKNAGLCPGKSWEEIVVPEHRDIKACLKTTLNPFKALNCEHYF